MYFDGWRKWTWDCAVDLTLYTSIRRKEAEKKRIPAMPPHVWHVFVWLNRKNVEWLRQQLCTENTDTHTDTQVET